MLLVLLHVFVVVVFVVVVVDVVDAGVVIAVFSIADDHVVIFVGGCVWLLWCCHIGLSYVMSLYYYCCFP